MLASEANWRDNLQMILAMNKEQADSLREQALKEFPVEACALMFGKLRTDRADVHKIVSAINKLRSSIRFEVDPMFVYSELTRAEKEGLEFIGIFHSHYAPANPSTTDLQFMRLWGSVVWIILSTIDGKMAAFREIDGALERVKIKR